MTSFQDIQSAKTAIFGMQNTQKTENKLILYGHRNIHRNELFDMKIYLLITAALLRIIF